MNQLEDFRKQIDDFMGRHPQSPLEQDAQRKFTGLDYYDENEELILDVLVERFPDDEPIVTMQTSSGDTQHTRQRRIQFAKYAAHLLTPAPQAGRWRKGPAGLSHGPYHYRLAPSAQISRKK